MIDQEWLRNAAAWAQELETKEMEEKKEGFVVRDLRGVENKDGDVCRVCGSIDVHTRVYNQPTMDCVKYFRTLLALSNG